MKHMQIILMIDSGKSGKKKKLRFTYNYPQNNNVCS